MSLKKTNTPNSKDQHSQTKPTEASLNAINSSPPPPPPDGGFNAWLQCANMFCLWFSAWGLVNSFGARFSSRLCLAYPC